MPGALILALIEAGIKIADRVITVMQDENGNVTIIDYAKTTAVKIDELLTKVDARLNKPKTP